jgi:hypothetical protein
MNGSRLKRHTFISRVADATLRVWIEPEVSLAESYGFNPRELSNILRIVAANRDLILRAWHDHFGD